MWRSQLDFRFLVLRSGETGRGMEDREKERCRERRMAKRGCKQAALRKVNNTKLTLFHFRSHLPFFSCFVRLLFVVKIICTFLYCQQAEVRRIELTRFANRSPRQQKLVYFKILDRICSGQKKLTASVTAPRFKLYAKYTKKREEIYQLESDWTFKF